MRIAQKLYEAGHITYMRTDSTNLGRPARAAILAMAEKKFGKEYAEPHTYATKSKNAQEAHEAIRPTHIEKRPPAAPRAKKALRAYLAPHHRLANGRCKTAQDKNLAETKDKKVPQFAPTARASSLTAGSRPTQPRAARMSSCPKVKKARRLMLKMFLMEEKQTTPPPRYTEAGLIKELEKRGIGRPSTYAHHEDAQRPRLCHQRGPHAHAHRHRRRGLDIS
jgi:DNA topoisomerase-1